MYAKGRKTVSFIFCAVENAGCAGLWFQYLLLNLAAFCSRITINTAGGVMEQAWHYREGLAALGSLARQAGCASSSPRKRGSVRTPGFSSANSAIHIKKPAQGGSFNMAGGEGLTARLKALALAALGSLARQAGCASSSPRKRGSVRTGFKSANSAIHIKKPAQGGSFNMAGGEGLTARLKALALAALGSLARQAGCASSSPRKRDSVRTGFKSANSAIHIKKPAQGGSFNMAGGEGLTARLKALALATLGSLARQGGLRIELAAQSAARFEPRGSHPQTPLSILKNPHKAGFLIWLGERDSNPR